MDSLDDFTKDLLAAAQDLKNGKFAKEFLRKEGTKLRQETLSEAKKKVKKKTGNLFKSIKRGKVYGSSSYHAINVYGKDVDTDKKTRHIYVINNGHRIVDKNGTEHGFKEGVHFFESAESNFSDVYIGDTEKWINDLLDNHGL